MAHKQVYTPVPELEDTMRTLSVRLRAAQEETARLEIQRNQLIATLIDEGYTTYKVAELAGIKQPRVVQLNNVQRGGHEKWAPNPRGASNQPRAAAS